MRAGAALAVLLACVAGGCGGAGETSTQGTPTASGSVPTETSASPAETEPAPADEPKPPPGLPGYTAGYGEWASLTRKPIPPRESGDAHLGTKRIFASKRRLANGRFPDGTIIVKEARRPGKDFVGLIAVMRKERGADPAHDDWQFVEWTREAPGERFTLTARDAVCWTCHAGAEQTDYVWIYTLGLGK